MKEYKVVVPTLNGQVYLNAMGSNLSEAEVNLTFVDLSDEELSQVVFKDGRLTVEQDSCPQG